MEDNNPKIELSRKIDKFLDEKNHEIWKEVSRILDIESSDEMQGEEIANIIINNVSNFISNLLASTLILIDTESHDSYMEFLFERTIEILDEKLENKALAKIIKDMLRQNGD